ncbi:MAG: fimbrial protein [Kluyvera sp.]|uniref:fimbrial protein n=1 Tax=Kluyvera sp. TaxID=1538228 RepID=UPI003F409D56
MKLINRFLFVFVLVFSRSVFSADAYCEADGGTHQSILSFAGTTISAAQNKTGQTIDKHVDNGGQYTGVCHCDNDYHVIYYTAKENSVLFESSMRNNIQYYSLNDYLDAGLSIAIFGRGYLPVPFSDEPNKSDGIYRCTRGKNSTPFTSGSDARIYFYIKEPFIGKTVIPRTLLASLYGKTSLTGQYSSTSLTDIYIQGDITAPQECVINGGQIIEFDFGEIPASEFSSQAGTALVDRKKSVTVSVKCTGMAKGQDVDVSLHATQSGAYPTMMQTTHPDVGIKVYDETDNEVDVNGGRMSTEMGKTTLSGDQNGNFNFSAAPASATGNRPAPDTFDATATLTIEMLN